MSTFLLVALMLGFSATSHLSQLSEFDAKEGLPIEVVDSAFKPVSGVLVQLFEIEESKGRHCEVDRQLAVAITDQDGKAIFRLNGPGRFCLHAELDGFATVWVGPFEIDSFDVPRRSVIVPVKMLLPPTIQSRLDQWSWPSNSGHQQDPFDFHHGLLDGEGVAMHGESGGRS